MKTLKQIKFGLFTTIAVLAVSSSSIAAEKCAVILKPKDNLQFVSLPTANLAEQSQAGYNSPNIKAYRKIENLKERLPQFKRDGKLTRGLQAVLEDESLSTFHALISKVADDIEAKIQLGQLTADASGAQIREAFKVALKNELVKFMPERMADAKIALLGNDEINKDKMTSILGRMSERESLEALVGRHGLRNIEADSLVGRYLAKARSQGIDVKTLVDSFRSAPTYGGRGPEKLFVSVDSRTGPMIEEIFGKNPHLMMHVHTPNQGTLNMYFNGERINYVSSMDGVISGQSANTIIPVITLSSYEASNAQNYFDLFKTNRPYAKYPWGLKRVDGESQVVEDYCRTGGYGSCTHWIGEMGIGEKSVPQYALPGNNADDIYGHGNQLEGESTNTSGLRISNVGSGFTHFKSASGNVTPIGNETRVDRLTRLVWSVGKGREQLWSMVGDRGAYSLSKGEWANPGYVLYAFLYKANSERVPMAFVYRENAEAPMTRETLDALTSSISPH